MIVYLQGKQKPTSSVLQQITHIKYKVLQKRATTNKIEQGEENSRPFLKENQRGKNRNTRAEGNVIRGHEQEEGKMGKQGRDQIYKEQNGKELLRNRLPKQAEQRS
jgi:hypothetical protein